MDPMIAACIAVVLLLTGLVFWVVRNRRSRRAVSVAGRDRVVNDVQQSKERSR